MIVYLSLDLIKVFTSDLRKVPEKCIRIESKSSRPVQVNFPVCDVVLGVTH